MFTPGSAWQEILRKALACKAVRSRDLLLKNIVVSLHCDSLASCQLSLELVVWLLRVRGIALHAPTIHYFFPSTVVWAFRGRGVAAMSYRELLLLYWVQYCTGYVLSGWNLSSSLHKSYCPVYDEFSFISPLLPNDEPYSRIFMFQFFQSLHFDNCQKAH